MSSEQKITQLLEEKTPALSAVQKEALWTQIESSLVVPTPIPTPFLFTFIQTRYMASFILALMLVLGSTGTVMASNSARPGDLLYPIDRATETVEGSFLRGDVKAHFTAELAQERVDELHALLNDDTKKDKEGNLSDEGKKNSNEAAVLALKMVDDIHLNNEARQQLLMKLRAELKGVDVGVSDDRLKDDEDDNEQGEDKQNKTEDSGSGKHSQESRGHDNDRRGGNRDQGDGVGINASTTINLDTGIFVPAGHGTGRADDEQDDVNENEREGDVDSTSAPQESINLHVNGEVELDD